LTHELDHWLTRYELAQKLAQQAGQVALQYFDRPLDVEWKDNQSPVTIADRRAEETLRHVLLDAYPEDGFLGEESGAQPGRSGYRWIVDPIDGTRNFVRGIPLWGTLIGLEYRGEVVAGVAYLPALGQLFHALKGAGAYRDGRRLRVSRVDAWQESQIFYSGVRWFLQSAARQAFIELCARTQRQRGIGDCYGFLLVAQGSGEAMVEYGVHPWDVAALKIIVEEAGGKCTDWTGRPDIARPDIVASNGLMHERLLAVLRDYWSGPFHPERIENEAAIT